MEIWIKIDSDDLEGSARKIEGLLTKLNGGSPSEPVETSSDEEVETRTLEEVTEAYRFAAKETSKKLAAEKLKNKFGVTKLGDIPEEDLGKAYTIFMTMGKVISKDDLPDSMKDEGPTLEDVKEAASKFCEVNEATTNAAKLELLSPLFEQFGCVGLKTLPESKYADFIAEVSDVAA